MENQENSILNSNVDIRSYLTSTADIKESCDSIETIDGTVINVLEPTCSNLIPVHTIDNTNQYVFIGSATTSATHTLAPVAVNSKKRSARFQSCSFLLLQIQKHVNFPIWVYNFCYSVFRRISYDQR